jgi:hypothetical protein
MRELLFESETSKFYPGPGWVALDGKSSKVSMLRMGLLGTPFDSD